MGTDSWTVVGRCDQNCSNMAMRLDTQDVPRQSSRAHCDRLQRCWGRRSMLSPGKGGAAPIYGHALGHATYERHRPEQTLLYQLVEKHYPALVEQLEFQGKSLPTHVHREFEAYLKCGRLEHGFLRVRCDSCHFERLVAFSCKKRGFCPSCGARRMAETAALLSDESISRCTASPVGDQFSFPSTVPVRRPPQAMGKVLGIIYRAISTHLIHKAGYRLKDGATGAVTLIQRFGSALNLNMPQGTFS